MKGPQMGRDSATDSTGQQLYLRAKGFIPGGTQLLSKRPELFLPDQWPAYFDKAVGCTVWDLDGRQLRDFTHCAVGTCILGYADEDVNAAVVQAIQTGNMTTLNCPEEVALAEVLLELHPWADMVRYARTGGEILAIAIRLARAASGRDRVAFCGYHGWHDWYLSANLAATGNVVGPGDGTVARTLDTHLLPGLDPAGVPAGLAGTVLPFRYNRIDELRKIVDVYGDELGAIIMEPQRYAAPEPGFLEEVRALADSSGAVLIIDEVTVGWRTCCGGHHLKLGIEPDVAVFAKALGNGVPMAAIVGKRAVMEAAQTSFVSSTYWTDRTGPAAALAMIRKHREIDVPARLDEIGRRIMSGWEAAARAAGLALTTFGLPPLANYRFDHDDDIAMQTLFIQEMFERGFLASNQVYAMYAHGDADIDAYLEAAHESFGVVAGAIAAGDIAKRLKGPVRHTGFSRLA